MYHFQKSPVDRDHRCIQELFEYSHTVPLASMDFVSSDPQVYKWRRYLCSQAGRVHICILHQHRSIAHLMFLKEERRSGLTLKCFSFWFNKHPLNRIFFIRHLRSTLDAVKWMCYSLYYLPVEWFINCYTGVLNHSQMSG